MFRLSVILATGQRFDFESRRMPRAWKSWVMQQCPYGTVFYGCRFERVAL